MAAAYPSKHWLTSIGKGLARPSYDPYERRCHVPRKSNVNAAKFVATKFTPKQTHAT